MQIMDKIEFFLVFLSLSGLIFVLALWLWLWRKHSASNIQSKHTSLIENEENQSEENQKASSELEKTKWAVHALLKDLKSRVQNLLDDATKYGNNLDEHASQLQKIQTLGTIQKIEELLLQEVESMRSSTNLYKKQLDEAQEKLQKQEQVLQKLSHDANTDFLTQINNRAAFECRINEEFSRYKRYGHIFSLILLDLDHFKDVNDTYGHLAGDRVLHAVASLLNEEKRTSDFLARYGGEEFALILPGIDSFNAHIVAEKLRKQVESTIFRYERYPIYISLSAGVTNVLPEDQSSTDVIKRVDEATYEAKKRGKNQVVVKNGNLFD